MQREVFRRDRLVLQREWSRAKLIIYNFIKACQIFRTSGADRDTIWTICETRPIPKTHATSLQSAVIIEISLLNKSKSVLSGEVL